MVCWIAQVKVATETEIFTIFRPAVLLYIRDVQLFSRLGQPKIELYVYMACCLNSG